MKTSKFNILVHSSKLSPNTLIQNMKKLHFPVTSKISKQKFSRINKKSIVVSMIDYPENERGFQEQLYLNYVSRKKNAIFVSLRLNRFGVSVGPVVSENSACLNCIREEIERFNSITADSSISRKISFEIGQAILISLIGQILQQKQHIIENKVAHVYGDLPKIYYDFVFRKPFCEVCTPDV
ncbi:MAG: hypothetical protein V1847_05195 [Candidatus Diapherotrites archaeon]